MVMSESIVSSPIRLTTSYLSVDDWDRLRSCSGRSTLAEIHYEPEGAGSPQSEAGSPECGPKRFPAKIR